MTDNRLRQVLFLFLLSLVLLAGLSFIPPFTVGEYSFKRISLISDITEIPAPVTKPDSVKAPESVIEEPVRHGRKPCPDGITCIEDFSADGSAMSAFLGALDSTSEKRVRVLFFGDSFIEGDIFTASLRDTLQARFGGKGPGFVPITSEVARFRSTIGHSFSGLKSFSIVQNPTEGETPVFGPMGNSAIPEAGGFVEYKPGKGQGLLPGAELLYSSSAVRRLRISLEDTTFSERVLGIAPVLRREKISSRPGRRIRLEFPEQDSINLFGVDFSQGTGVILDNMALRGNSGMSLSRISNNVWREFDRDETTKLVVLQYGLNVVGEKDSSNYDAYVSSMERVVDKVKLAFPGSSILIISVSDRSTNVDGNYRTIPGIIAMRAAQRRLAQKTGVAFWDLFAAMGGENSMPEFVSHQPPMAGKDYTHVNFTGGRFLSRKFAEALFFEKERNANP